MEAERVDAALGFGLAGYLWIYGLIGSVGSKMDASERLGPSGKRPRLDFSVRLMFSFSFFNCIAPL